jgi:peptidoglycan/LPS O-acetylase OafA/YrhL
MTSFEMQSETISKADVPRIEKPLAPSLSFHSSSEYRADIDGLRAIAVLAVIAYHFNIHPIKGGFTGVDIFFVISGYLITGNIIAKLDVGQFSYLDFYQRRIRRIFPALLALLIFTATIGLSLLGKDAVFRVGATSPFSELYSSIIFGAGFVTNLAMLRAGNYFFQTPVNQPLLHLWSLAIEEQFYIVWPLILFGANALKLRYLPVVITIAVVSFAINIATAHSDPTLAFYSTLSRAWELMLGAVLACPIQRRFVPNDANRDAASIAGLTLIVAGLLLIKTSMPYPGWAALLPTVGTVLAISAGEDSIANRYILSTKPMVWIGLISYPLYLWHWPALLLFQTWSSHFSTGSYEKPIAKALTLCGLAAASWLTFRYIEVPFRFGRIRKPRYATLLLLMMGATAALAGSALETGWSPYRLSPYQSKTLSLLTKVSDLKDMDKLYGERPCFKYHESDTAALFLNNKCFEITHPGRKSVFLIGDSHSASLSLGLRPLLEHANINFFQVSTGFCEPTSNNKTIFACDEINQLAASKIRELKPDVVIIDAFWMLASRSPYFIGNDDYLAALIAKLKSIQQSGVQTIIVIGQIPTWQPSLPNSLAQNFVRKNAPIPQRTFEGVDAGSLQMDTKMKAIEFPAGVIYLSLRDLLCNESGCLVSMGPDLETDLTVWDYGHLTPAASSFVVQSLVAPVLNKFVSLQ